jgi:hypothetical protein
VSYALSHSTVLPPCSLNLSGLWEVISLPFCLLRQAWIWTWALTSLMSSASLPSLVPAPHQVPLCIWGLHPNLLGGWFSLWIKLCIGTWLDLLRVVLGMHPGEGRWQITISTILDETPRNVAGISNWDTGHWDNLAGSEVLLFQHRLSRPMSKGWAPRTKDLNFYTLASRLQ